MRVLQPFRSLRGKLLLLSTLLIVVPGALLTAIAYVGARDALVQRGGRQLAQVAHDVLDEVQEDIANAQTTLNGWASQDVLRDLVVRDLDKRISRFLQSLVSGGTPFSALRCIDRADVVVAASDPALLGTTDSHVAHGDHASRSGPLPVDAPGPHTIELAVPIPDPERPDERLGVLVGDYDWPQALARTGRIRRSIEPHSPAVDVFVLDAAGNVLGESWRRGTSPARIAHLRSALAAFAHDLPHGRRSGWDADRRVDALIGWGRARATADPAWTVFVLQPLPEALAPVTRMRRRLGTALALVLIGGLLLAAMLSARMSRPLVALTRATEALARTGERPAPVAVESRDEIGTLATTFNAMAARLRDAQDELLTSAKLVLAGELASGIAHEVRTPLGIMRTSAQMLSRSLPADREDERELATMIVGEVDRLERVVAGLVELSRPRPVEPETTPLAPLLERALGFVAGQARQRGVTLRRAIESTSAHCDPDQAYQVALNLLVNALQMVSVGGHVTVRTLRPGDGHTGFVVEDDGPGVPPALRERIFTPFFSRREGGTGLGLALVQRMVQMNRGRVSVGDAPGGGAAFRVELPVAKDAA
jgi:signal transduction histidine kinase